MFKIILRKKNLGLSKKNFEKFAIKFFFSLENWRKKFWNRIFSKNFIHNSTFWLQIWIQDDFSFHCYLSAQVQEKNNQWSWGQLWYTEVRYSPWKKIQHRARLMLSTHTGPSALLDYPYMISLPYGFPQTFSLGHAQFVNSLMIRWRRGIRIALLHNS